MCLLLIKSHVTKDINLDRNVRLKSTIHGAMIWALLKRCLVLLIVLLYSFQFFVYVDCAYDLFEGLEG